MSRRGWGWGGLVDHTDGESPATKASGTCGEIAKVCYISARMITVTKTIRMSDELD